MQQCAAAMRLLVDGMRNFIVVLGDYEELHRVALTVHEIVHHIIHHKQGAEAKHHQSPIVEDKVARRHYDDVANGEHTPQRYVAILVNDGCQNVGAAGAAMLHEYEAQTNATQRRTDDACHKTFVRTHHLQQCAIGLLKQHLHHAKHKGDGKNAIDGLNHKSETQYLQRQYHKTRIYQKIRYVDRNSRNEIHNIRNTRHTTYGDLIRQHKCTPTYGVEQHAYGEEQIVS